MVDLLTTYGQTCTNLSHLAVRCGDIPERLVFRTSIQSDFFNGPSGFGASVNNNVPSDTLIDPSSESTHSNQQPIFLSPTVDNPSSIGVELIGGHNIVIGSPPTSNNLSSSTGPIVSSELAPFAVNVNRSNTNPSSALFGTSNSSPSQATDANSIFGTVTPAFGATPAGTGLFTGSQGTQSISNCIAYQPPPPPKTFSLTNLIRLIQNNSELQSLNLVGPMFFRKRPSIISKLFRALPLTVERLTIGCTLSANGPPPFHVVSSYDDEGSNDHNDNNSDSDSEYEKPLNIKWIEFAQSLLEEQALIPLLKRCHRLETLVNNLHSFSQEIPPPKILSSVIRDHCPRLVELQGRRSFNTGEQWSFLMDASKSGWKYVRYPECFGPSSAAALLKHVQSLEILSIYHCQGFTSPVIQRILCSAPNLKRLEALEMFSYGESAPRLDTQDVIQSRWVCDKLEVLKIKITGIPRPDLVVRTNGRPLSGPLHMGHMEDSFLIQRRIYSQLGALTHLTDLFLGTDVDEDVGNHELQWEEVEIEGEYYGNGELQIHRQYECLSFTLESGMDRLGNLKSLKRIHLQGMSVGFNGDAEQEWIKKNWPALKYSHGDWNRDRPFEDEEDDDQIYPCYFNF
ncbi:hypothetical protein BGX27_000652 [Mortierella sp. AM989]|nr:hypothetical protein BGX27_000652 [Mortierella sp. AM989]